MVGGCYKYWNVYETQRQKNKHVNYRGKTRCTLQMNCKFGEVYSHKIPFYEVYQANTDNCVKNPPFMKIIMLSLYLNAF